jgi:hypothetical protein
MPLGKAFLEQCTTDEILMLIAVVEAFYGGRLDEVQPPFTVIRVTVPGTLVRAVEAE